MHHWTGIQTPDRVPQHFRMRERVKNSMRQLLLVLLFAMTMATLSTIDAVAAPASATPESEHCTIDPLDPNQLTAIVRAGFEPAPRLEKSDQPAPATDLVAMFDVLTESVACTNANQPMRALALYTDRYLAERFSGQQGADELGHLIAASSRSPKPAAPEDQLVLLSVADPILYGDGRIGATVTTANADETFVDQIIFASTDSGWRIDQVVLGEAIHATPAATPGSTQP